MVSRVLALLSGSRPSLINQLAHNAGNFRQQFTSQKTDGSDFFREPLTSKCVQVHPPTGRDEGGALRVPASP